MIGETNGDAHFEQVVKVVCVLVINLLLQKSHYPQFQAPHH